MAGFLIVASLIFLIFGSMLLLSPETFTKISKSTNRVLFSLDDKINAIRRPIGILLLVLTIFLWYIALWK